MLAAPESSQQREEEEAEELTAVIKSTVTTLIWQVGKKANITKLGHCPEALSEMR